MPRLTTEAGLCVSARYELFRLEKILSQRDPFRMIPSYKEILKKNIQPEYLI